MISDELFQQLELLYAVTAVPFCVFSRGSGLIRAWPERARPFFYSRHKGETIRSVPPPHLLVNGIRIIYEEEFFCRGLTNLSEDYFVVTMPVSPVLCTSLETAPGLLRKIPPEEQAGYLQLLASVPPTDTQKLIQILSLIRVMFTGSPGDGVDVLEGDARTLVRRQKLDEEQLDTALRLPAEEEAAAVRELTDRQIELILDTLQAGEGDRLETLLARYGCSYAEKLSLHFERHAKYSGVILLHDACSRAVAGGLPADTARKLFALYSQQMDLLADAVSVRDFVFDCLRDYCRRVQKAAHMTQYSRYTKQACTWIREHLYQPIRLDDLAACLNLNRSTLCRYFRQDTGMTIMEYTMEQRLQEAAWLLKSSSMSLGEISSLLQFSQQSYFGKKFRERFGMTPRAWRAAETGI